MPREPQSLSSPPSAQSPNLAPTCRGLSEDERFVVGVIRQIVVNGIDAPAAEQAFASRCGPPGTPAIEALRHWLVMLAENARRQIAVGYLTRCCPSPDEVTILAIIEGSRRGDFARAHALLARIVRVDAIDPLAHAAEQLGEALFVIGIRLRPVRFVGPGGR